MIEKLEKSILSTLVYFNLFDYPLTLMEIYQWLLISDDSSFKMSQIKNLLDSSSKIQNKEGLYFLTGRDEIIRTRKTRYGLSQEKNKIIKRGIRFLKFFPYIEMIGACNNTGSDNAKKDSDIDLFIIVKSGRLYLTRFFVTLVISFLGLRRHGKKISNRLCLSFYITDDNLNLEKIKSNDLDIYLIYWIANLFPFYDRGVYGKFMDQNNWVKNYLFNLTEKKVSYRRKIKDSVFSQSIYKFFEILLSGLLGNGLEKLFKKIQLLKMSKNKKSLFWQNDNRVVISDSMLKFHENDRRQYYREKFQQKLSQIYEV